MSLYRQQRGSPWGLIAVAAIVALIIGAVAGYAIGRSSAPEPSLSEQVTEVHDQVQPVLDGISLVPDHYAQSVRGGDVVEPVQYEGATQQLAAAQEALDGAAADLRLLNADAYASADQSLEELVQAVESKDEPARISELADQAQAAVSGAAGGE